MTAKNKNEPYGPSVKESKPHMKTDHQKGKKNAALTLNYDIKNFLASALKVLRLVSQRVSNGSSFHLSDQDVGIECQPDIYRGLIETHMYRLSVNLYIDQGSIKDIDRHSNADVFSTHCPKLLYIFFS